MSTKTHYIVQTSPTTFVHDDAALGFVEGFGASNAAQLTFGQARQLYRQFLASAEDGARRFPRIIKVTTMMKTITNNR